MLLHGASFCVALVCWVCLVHGLASNVASLTREVEGRQLQRTGNVCVSHHEMDFFFPMSSPQASEHTVHSLIVTYR